MCEILLWFLFRFFEETQAEKGVDPSRMDGTKTRVRISIFT